VKKIFSKVTHFCPILITFVPRIRNIYQNKESKTMAHACENCKFRAHYDEKPDSLLGKFWRWHINFCPGWKAYFTSQGEEKKSELRAKYNFTKY